MNSVAFADISVSVVEDETEWNDSYVTFLGTGSLVDSVKFKDSRISVG